jgi:hypothetical protein
MLALILRYVLQKSKGVVASMTRLSANNVDISGESTKRLYLTFIADSLQLMIRAVRNIGVTESDDLASSAHSSVTTSHRAPILMLVPSCVVTNSSISVTRESLFLVIRYHLRPPLPLLGGTRESFGFLLGDPLVGAGFEHAERESATIEDFVVEGANVEFGA